MIGSASKLPRKLRCMYKDGIMVSVYEDEDTVRIWPIPCPSVFHANEQFLDYADDMDIERNDFEVHMSVASPN